MSVIDKKTLDKYIQQYSFFDHPVPFSTNEFITKKQSSIKSNLEQLNVLESMSKSQRTKDVEDMIVTLKDNVEQLKSRKDEILLYPVSLEDYNEFLSSLWILQIRKEDALYQPKSLPESIGDFSEEMKDLVSNFQQSNMTIEQQQLIISMSNLDFVCLQHQLYGVNDLSKLGVSTVLDSITNIFKFVLRAQDINCQLVFIDNSNCLTISLGEKKIHIFAEDWDNLRKIISAQNIPGYDDEYVTPDVRIEQNKIASIKSREYEQPTMERRVAVVSCLTGISPKDVFQMTARRFLLEEGVALDINSYNNQFLAMVNGAKFDGGIEHFLYKKKKLIPEGFSDLDSAVDKFK